jgi:RNA polymerase-binding transcription factor DksA
MAKTKKKTAAKPAKKSAVKAKPAAKSKKSASAKAKKPVAKKKPAPKKVAKKSTKKVVAKKVVASKVKAKKVVAKKPAKAVTKKAAPKVISKAAPKTAPKKAVEKAIKKEAPKPKAVKKPVESMVKAEPKAPAPAKPVPQLTIFPIVNQRPIAHKPAKPSTASDDKTRYNEEELKEFEALIHGKLDKAREEFRILKETLNRNNDAGTDSTSGGNTKVLEDGAETAEKENLSQLAARQLKYITNLENALVRIKNGTYGICSVTGKLIPKERLIAVPHTTQSIEAKMMKQD